MKISAFLGLTLFFAAVSQMFAAPDMRLTLNADGNICNINVTGGTATRSGTCGTLVATVVGPSHGQVLVNGNLGNYRISDTANGFNAAVLPALQDLNQLDVECAPKPTATRCNGALGVGGVFTATFTDTSVPTQSSTFAFSISVVAGTTTNIVGKVDFSAFNDNSDLIPATAGLIGSKTLTGPNNKASLISANHSPGVPYSLTTIEKLHFNHNGSIQANAEIASLVPEPASIMLTGTMLLFMSIGLRRKLRARAVRA